MWDFWQSLDFTWVTDFTVEVWNGVANMIASFAPLLALMIGLAFGFWVISAIIGLFRRKEGESWW